MIRFSHQNHLVQRHLPVYALLLTLLASPVLFAQTGSTGSSVPIPQAIAESVLLEVEDESFSVREIATAYGKSPGKDSLSFYALDEEAALSFVELYADFRLKVHEALDRGLHTRAQFVEEMSRNRDNVALGIGAFGSISGEGYLFQREVVDRGVDYIWQRRSHEYKVAVIFSAMNPDVPADTARALKRSLDMLEAINNGKDFGKMAADSTNDGQSAEKKGVIGWVTGGMLPREMEAAILETEAGKVYQGVVRLPAGFALIKVVDKDERRRVRIAHMAFEVTRNMDGTTSREESLKRAEEAYARLQNGESFEVVARDASDDRTSAEHGGDLLAYYTRSLGFESRPGKLPPDFENALFALEPGEYSGVVEDPTIGFRIVKMLESREITFEEEEEALRAIYRRNFFDRDRQSYIQKVMLERGYRVDPAVFEEFLKSIDTTRSSADPDWKDRVSPSLLKKEIFFLGKMGWTVADFIDTIETNQRYRSLPLSRVSILTTIFTVVEAPALRSKIQNLEERYPDFLRLMNEFRDGALIFELEQNEIYTKVAYEEEEGKRFFEDHRSNYNTPVELRPTEVYVFTERDAQKVLKRVTSGGEDIAEVASRETERVGYRQKRGGWPLMKAKDSDLVRSILAVDPTPEVGKVYGPLKSGGGWSVLRVDEISEPRPMTYEEARGWVMGDFNDWKEKELRENMLKELRKKFSVEIDNRNLRKALALR